MNRSTENRRFEILVLVSLALLIATLAGTLMNATLAAQSVPLQAQRGLPESSTISPCGLQASMEHGAYNATHRRHGAGGQQPEGEVPCPS
jgi:hypothetical protein